MWVGGGVGVSPSVEFTFLLSPSCQFAAKWPVLSVTLLLRWGGRVKKSPSVLCSALHENKTRDRDFLPPFLQQPHALPQLHFSEWQKLLVLKYHPGFSCDSFTRHTQNHLAQKLHRFSVQLSVRFVENMSFLHNPSICRFTCQPVDLVFLIPCFAFPLFKCDKFERNTSLLSSSEPPALAVALLPC